MSTGASSLPPLAWLRAFEASARHLSFTRAAGELGLTQSAISQHIRNLEAYLGRDLFLRKTRALELTEDGGNYLPIVREAFQILSNGTQAFTGDDRGRTLTLHCNLAFSIYWLAPRLYKLYAAHPWLTLNIVTPIWDPERHATHAALEIRFGRPEDLGANAQKLSDATYFPVCAPDYQDGIFNVTTAKLFDCAGVTGSWGTWLSAGGAALAPGQNINLASTYVIAMQAALNGAGMALTHDILVRDYLEQGTLVAPSQRKLTLNEGYYLLPMAQYAETSAALAFRDWLFSELSLD